MRPVIYQKSGLLADGEPLPGQYQWATSRQLTGVTVSGQPPSAGTLQLVLEIGGVLTDFAVVIPAGTEPFEFSQELLATIPAATDVRWQAVYDGSPETAASQISLTMTVLPTGSVQPPSLTVRDGGSGQTCYQYDPSTHQFSAVIPAEFTPGWVLAQDGANDLSVSIGGVVVFQVQNGAVYVNSGYALGGVASADNPRAVFYCGDTPLATVSASGCRFANVTEEAPDEVSSLDMTSQTRFEFYSGGELTAVLDATGLTTAQVIEGIP